MVFFVGIIDGEKGSVGLAELRGLSTYSYIQLILLHSSPILMKRFAVLFAALLLGGALTLPMSSEAQGLKVGPRLGIPLGTLSDASSVFVGADARLQVPALPIVPQASFDYYLMDADNVSVYTVDINALYEFPLPNPMFKPYAGAGIGITGSSVDTQLGTQSDTDAGLNLVGGARFPLSTIEPFVQLNAVVTGDSDEPRVGLAGGILFGF